MDKITKAVSAYIKEQGIPISTLSAKIGISYGILQPCVSGRRNLRASEFMRICNYFHADPRSFATEEIRTQKESRP